MWRDFAGQPRPVDAGGYVDSFEWNKIAGWSLAALVSVLALIIVTGHIYAPVLPAKPGYIVEGVEEVAAAGPAAAVAEKPIAFYLASADVAKGEAVFKKCGACHNAAKGGAAGIGPNLYGIVGNIHAHMPGFAYSDAMAATKGKPWGFDEINAWLTNPKAYIAGNKMSFGGIAKPEERAAVIAWLNTQSDKPLPLPPVPAETAAAPAPTALPGAAAADSPASAPAEAKKQGSPEKPATAPAA